MRPRERAGPPRTRIAGERRTGAVAASRRRRARPVDICVLVPVLDEAATVEDLARRVAEVLDGLGRSFEIVFIDDGSRDGTCERVREAHAADPRVKLVRLRRNFGKAAALSAGFDVSRGDLVLTIDGDLQDDPEEIPRLLAALEEGDLDLVSGWKLNRQDPASSGSPRACSTG